MGNVDYTTHLVKGEKYKVKSFEGFSSLTGFKCPYFREELNTEPKYIEIGSDETLTFEEVCFCSVQDLGKFPRFTTNSGKTVYINHWHLLYLVKV